MSEFNKNSPAEGIVTEEERISMYHGYRRDGFSDYEARELAWPSVEPASPVVQPSEYGHFHEENDWGVCRVCAQSKAAPVVVSAEEYVQCKNCCRKMIAGQICYSGYSCFPAKDSPKRPGWALMGAADALWEIYYRRDADAYMDHLEQKIAELSTHPAPLPSDDKPKLLVSDELLMACTAQLALDGVSSNIAKELQQWRKWAAALSVGEKESSKDAWNRHKDANPDLYSIANRDLFEAGWNAAKAGERDNHDR